MKPIFLPIMNWDKFEKSVRRINTCSWIQYLGLGVAVAAMLAQDHFTKNMWKQVPVEENDLNAWMGDFAAEFGLTKKESDG